MLTEQQLWSAYYQSTANMKSTSLTQPSVVEVVSRCPAEQIAAAQDLDCPRAHSHHLFARFLFCVAPTTPPPKKREKCFSSHMAHDSGFKCMVRPYKLSTSESLQLLKAARFSNQLYCLQYLSLAVQSFTLLPALTLI